MSPADCAKSSSARGKQDRARERAVRASEKKGLFSLLDERKIYIFACFPRLEYCNGLSLVVVVQAKKGWNIQRRKKRGKSNENTRSVFFFSPVEA